MPIVKTISIYWKGFEIPGSHDPNVLLCKEMVLGLAWRDLPREEVSLLPEAFWCERSSPMGDLCTSKTLKYLLKKKKSRRGGVPCYDGYIADIEYGRTARELRTRDLGRLRTESTCEGNVRAS